MSEENKTTKTPRARARAKVTTDAPKPAEEKVATTRPSRTRKASAETSAKKTTEVEKERKIEGDDYETVTLAEEKAFVQPTTEDIAVAITARNADDTKFGSPDYSIGTSFKDVLKMTDEKVLYYPLATWSRNPATLENLANLAGMRMMDGSESDNDLNLIDFAEQNRANDDRYFFSFFAQPNSDWNNYLPVGDRKLRSSKLNFHTKATGGELSNNDDQLCTVLFRRLELGQPLLVRLWHSGLIFAINPVEKAERIAMVDRLNAAHLETLRRTNGIIHGTSSYYANRIIIQSFMKLVRDSNIHKNLWADVANLVDHRDIQIMAWALMASSYQRGYNYVDTCGGLKTKLDADKKPVLDAQGKEQKVLCSHRTEGLIDLSLIVQIDNSKFSDWQKEFISQPLSDTKKYGIEDIEKYQRLGKMHEVDTLEIAEGVSVLLKAPVAAKHISIGEEWIESVEDAVDAAITTNVDDVTRNEMIQRQIEATAALDVAHWVIGFNIDGEEVDSEKAVKETFRMLSNNEEIRDSIYTKIRERMSKRLAAVVAIPTHKCEGCGELSNIINNNGTTIYTPIDTVSRFFTLTARNP